MGSSSQLLRGDTIPNGSNTLRNGMATFLNHPTESASDTETPATDAPVRNSYDPATDRKSVV